MKKIAEAYGIPFIRVNEEGTVLKNAIQETLNMDGPAICEIIMHPEQTLFPKSASFMDENGKMTSAPLDRMAPFMPEELQVQCVYRKDL